MLQDLSNEDPSVNISCFFCACGARLYATYIFTESENPKIFFSSCGTARIPQGFLLVLQQSKSSKRGDSFHEFRSWSAQLCGSTVSQASRSSEPTGKVMLDNDPVLFIRDEFSPLGCYWQEKWRKSAKSCGCDRFFPIDIALKPVTTCLKWYI